MVELWADSGKLKISDKFCQNKWTFFAKELGEFIYLESVSEIFCKLVMIQFHKWQSFVVRTLYFSTIRRDLTKSKI